MTMKKRNFLLAATLALIASGVAAHDLFLKLSTYFLPPDKPVEAVLLNGTFTRSENSVTRDRIGDFSLVGGRGRTRLDSTGIVPRGDTTRVRFTTGAPGTYVLGISIKPRELALKGADFNAYLKEEGITETLAERTRAGTLNEPARERYAKHVKAILQVGTEVTDQYATVLGYPAEIVPLENPYHLNSGSTLRVRCLVQGISVQGVTVLAGGLTPQGRVIKQIGVTTDASGIAAIPLTSPGRWYVKFIRMKKSTEGNLTHESQWATLTFELR
jgi:uncharacterized GH25 family protein